LAKRETAPIFQASEAAKALEQAKPKLPGSRSRVAEKARYTFLMVIQWDLPSGKHTKNYGKSPFSMGKSTISMAMFNSFLYVYQRVKNT